jgi:hypothetical protein
MPRIEIGRCPSCGTPLRVTDLAVQPAMRVFCRCRWQGTITVAPERVQEADTLRQNTPADVPAWLHFAVVVAGLVGIGGGGYYGGLTLQSWGGVFVGVWAGIALAFLLLLPVVHLYRDIRDCQRLGCPFRMALWTHNLLALYLGVGCALLGAVAYGLSAVFWESRGLWFLGLLGVLVCSFLTARYLFRLLVPARCWECAGAAYYRSGAKHVGVDNTTTWTTEFTCRACGQISNNRME